MRKANATPKRSMTAPPPNIEGILLINKPRGVSSFSLVRQLRRHLDVRKIGHAGTLDPFATGVMVMLIGKKYTRQSNTFLNADKAYRATLHLGITTDSYDCDGQTTAISPHIPTEAEVIETLHHFQGTLEQIPPMFSAKKRNGKKLYELARAGQSVPRAPVTIELTTTLRSYNYPHLAIDITCSKGTYIRTLAYDIGTQLSCGAHLIQLERTRSGAFSIDQCFDGALLKAKCIRHALIEQLIQ